MADILKGLLPWACRSAMLCPLNPGWWASVKERRNEYVSIRCEWYRLSIERTEKSLRGIMFP